MLRGGERKIIPRFMLMDFIEVKNFFKMFSPSNQIAQIKHNGEELEFLMKEIIFGIAKNEKHIELSLFVTILSLY